MKTIINDWNSTYLTLLADRLIAYRFISDQPLTCDRWIASSILQKSIRRNEITMARRAALALHNIDQAGVWRRLMAIVLEDVGAADIGLVMETVAAATSPNWRSRQGDDRVLTELVGRLAQAPKDRSADYLMWWRLNIQALRKLARFAAIPSFLIA